MATRSNFAPVPRPGRLLSAYAEYNKSASVQSYADGDDCRIDNQVVADYGLGHKTITLSAGTWTFSAEIETLANCNNAVVVVRRASDFNKYAEQHVLAPNQTRRRVSQTFTLTSTTTVELYFGVGSYGVQSAGSAKFGNFMFEASTTLGTYFDGATPDTSTTNYSWLGTPFNSVSTAETTTTTPTPPANSGATDPALAAMCLAVQVGYDHRFVRSDGAVLQREQDSKIPSEAPAYALNFYVQTDNPAAFARTENFCRSKLERRNWQPGGPDNWRAGTDNDPRVLCPDLMGWDFRVNPYGGNGPNTMFDWNFATDADVDRGKALFNAAAKGWGPNGGQDYKNKALEIARQIDRFAHNIGTNGLGYQTSDEYGQNGPVGQNGRAAGHHAFNGGGEFEMNPSYIDQQFNHLARNIGNNARYDQHIAGGYDVIDKATNNTGGISPNVGLAPDWVTMNTSDLDPMPLTSGQRGWTYSRATWQKYDGFRTWFRLYWAWKFYGDAEALALLQRGAVFYADEWTTHGSISAEYDLAGNRLSGGYSNTIFTAAAYYCLIADESNATNLAIAQEIWDDELDPDLLYATDADGFKYWATSKFNTGPTQWNYFGDSWMQFFYLERCGLWQNFGQTTVSSGASQLKATVKGKNTLVINEGLRVVVKGANKVSARVVRSLKATVKGKNTLNAKLSQTSSGGSAPPPNPTVPRATRERFLWRSPNGSETELTDYVTGLEVQRGLSGRGLPSIRTKTLEVYNRPGQITTHVSHGPRVLKMPIRQLAVDNEKLQQLLAYLIDVMDPVEGEGTLVHVDRDNVERTLSCRVLKGLEWEGEEEYGIRSHITPLQIVADDPYWYGPTLTKKFTGKPALGWFPIWRPDGSWLGSSAVLGQITLDVASQVETDHVTRFVGPGLQPQLINNDTGEKIVLHESTVLGPGETMTVDTREGVVYGPGGPDDNWYPRLTERDLWLLQPGRNSITATMAEVTESSYIAVAYREATKTTSIPLLPA